MISITSKTGSSDGLIFEELPTSKLRDLVPRVTKAKTLDGGVVYDHRGMITADREFEIKANLTEPQAIALQLIVENETFINLSNNEGFFEGVIGSVGLDSGITTIRFWVYVPIVEIPGSTKRMYEHENVTITENIALSVA